jgi:hypothetical protein
MLTKPISFTVNHSSTIVSPEELTALTLPLVGLRVSLARQINGCTLAMDLGRLAPASGPRRYLRGEFSILFDWDWRFETDSGIVFGSSSSEPFIYAQLTSLGDQSVSAVRLERGAPDLVVELSGGLRVRSAGCVEGGPHWSVWLSDSSWLYCAEGALHHEPAGRGEAPRLTAARELEIARSEEAAKRWGEKLSSAAGTCKDCACRVSLDGAGSFLDYGVCSSPRSLMDGRVVSLRSGCAAFSEA